LAAKGGEEGDSAALRKVQLEIFGMLPLRASEKKSIRGRNRNRLFAYFSRLQFFP